VFRNFGLDFCCGGKKTLMEACKKKNIDVEKVKKELLTLNSNDSDQHNYNSWSLDFLVDYIVNNHHRFVRQKLPEIEFYAHKVAKVHGKRHEELKEIEREFLMIKDELLNHMDKEELMLFPYIKQLVEFDKNRQKVDSKPQFKRAANPIRMMEEEHDEVGRAMAKIQRLSNNFTPPKDACATYQVLFQNLEGFQKDMHKHVHLENNILFPKAIELEQGLS
ncbi:MAG: iron-sulfur cluster repair di-iron protein, partial [Balneolaceae bacterium]